METGKFDNYVVSLTEYDSNDEPVNPNRYDMNYTRDGSGNVLTMFFTDYKNTWTKTFTYAAGYVSKISRWVKS